MARHHLLRPRVENTPSIQRAMREAFYAGVISFGLFFLLIGLKTDQNIRNELILGPRWGLLAIVVGLVMRRALPLRRLAAAALRGAARPRTAQAAPVAAVGRNGLLLEALHQDRRSASLILYPVIIVRLVGFQGSLKWVDNFGIQILIYVMLAWGLNIVVGLAGLLDLGYVAFYAVGAYCYALLGTEFGLVVLDPAAGRRPDGRVLGRDARLPGAAPAAATISPS